MDLSDLLKKVEDLRVELSTHERNLDTLKEELEKRVKAQKKLDEEMLKAKMLNEGDQEKEREAEENWKKINEIKPKITVGQYNVNRLTLLKNKAEKEALDSIRPKYMRSYTQAVKDFVRELKKAQEMEIEIRKLRHEGNKVASGIALSGAYNIPKHAFLPSLKSVLIAPDGEHADRNPINSFIEYCRSKGLDILEP